MGTTLTPKAIWCQNGLKGKRRVVEEINLSEQSEKEASCGDSTFVRSKTLPHNLASSVAQGPPWTVRGRELEMYGVQYSVHNPGHFARDFGSTKRLCTYY